MRENRPYGSEGGEGTPFPTPIVFILYRSKDVNGRNKSGHDDEG
jgi:hypothetical protein